MPPRPVATRRPASYDDIVALPEHQVGELIDGELIVSPRPAPVHALAASALGGELLGPYQRGRGGPGGWLILFEPELHLDADVLVPDLAGWRRERMPALPAEAFFRAPADWVCEVLSPSTAVIDRTRKLRVYARHGVAWVWLVDPANQLVEVLRLAQGEWMLAGDFGGAEKARMPPFDGIEIELAALWDPAPPPPG